MDVTRRTVEAEADGIRIDAFVARTIEAVSRRHAKELAREGRIRCGGRVVPAAHVVHTGEVVEVDLPAVAASGLPKVAVLREDAAFVYLHKPAGLHTVRHRPGDPPTLADVARSIDPRCAEASPDPREAGALHRLDVGTSGVVAFARTAEAWTRGRAALERSWKLYLARSDSPPPSWPPAPAGHVRPLGEAPRWPAGASLPPPSPPGVEATWPLRGSGARGHRVRLDEEGLPAVSRLWPTTAERSVFAVEILTGRRHQIRVHMAALGMPIDGDPLYGSGTEGGQVRLHAWAFQLGPDEPVVLAEPPAWCQP